MYTVSSSKFASSKKECCFTTGEEQLLDCVHPFGSYMSTIWSIIHFEKMLHNIVDSRREEMNLYKIPVICPKLRLVS